MADRESQQVGAGSAAADAQVCANIHTKSPTDSAFAEAAHVREAAHAATLKEKEKLLAAYQQEALRLRGQLRSACEKGRTDDQGDLDLEDAIDSISHLETEILGYDVADTTAVLLAATEKHDEEQAALCV